MAAITGCGRYRYINPNPHYDWPAMESSRIGGALGVYVPENNLHLVYQHDISDECCKHRDIRIGSGLLKAARQSADAVFAETIILTGQPTDTYIKSLNLRGLLHLKDATANVEFIPYIPDNKNAESVHLYNVRISLNLNFSAIDFLLDDIREFNIVVDSESDVPVKSRDMNKTLKRLSDKVFEKASDYLARELVTVYGARS